MKIAIVHDYFREFGGGERVVQALHEVWPKAPIYTSFTDWSRMGLFAPKFKKLKIKTSWAQHFCAIKKYPGPLRFLIPFVWRSFNFDGFDIVLSSSGANIAKGIQTPPKTMHICYCHTPPHYLYGYTTSVAFEKYWPLQIYSQLLSFFLRYYDFQTSLKVDYFIANSHEVASRIKKFYKRESMVIYPPVSLPQKPRKGVSLTKIKKRPLQNYFLSGGRLERFKNFDLVIKSFNQLKLPLLIYGTGRQEKNLKKLAGSTIKFLGQVSDAKLASYYANSKAFIFTSENEDFGITPVEAQAYGKPVIAYFSGGVKETILEGKTGLFFKKLTVESLVQTVRKFAKLNFKPEACHQQAQKFSKERFEKEIKKFVEEKWQEFQKK